MRCRTSFVLKLLLATCVSSVIALSSFAGEPPAVPAGCTIMKNADKLVAKDKNTYGNIEECTFKPDCGPAYKGGTSYPGWASKPYIKDGKVDGDYICVSRGCKGGASLDIWGTCKGGQAAAPEPKTAPPAPAPSKAAAAPSPAPAPVKKVNCVIVVEKFKKNLKKCSILKIAEKKKGCFEHAIGVLKKAESEACASDIEAALSEIKMEENKAIEKSGENPAPSKDEKKADSGNAGKLPPKTTECEILVQKTIQQSKPQADKCQKIKDEPKRKECFEKMHQSLMKNPKLKACESEFEAMKSSFESQ